jgi:hypothetical protein
MSIERGYIVLILSSTQSCGLQARRSSSSRDLMDLGHISGSFGGPSGEA